MLLLSLLFIIYSEFLLCCDTSQTREISQTVFRYLCKENEIALLTISSPDCMARNTSPRNSVNRSETRKISGSMEWDSSCRGHEVSQLLRLSVI